MKRLYEVGDDTQGKVSVYLNGTLVPKVYACRAGSNGWVDAYSDPCKLNDDGDAIRCLPRMRGNVTIKQENMYD